MQEPELDPAVQEDSVARTRPVRVALLVLDLGAKSTNDAVRYALLYLNSVQSSFEYLLVPPNDDHTLRELNEVPGSYDSERLLRELPTFEARYSQFLQSESSRYRTPAPEYDCLVVISRCALSDYYYLVATETACVIAVGHWDRYMAPPSLVEFLVSRVVVASVDHARPGEWITKHFETTACPFDFTADISHARNSVLIGHICSKCAERIRSNLGSAVLMDAKKVLSLSWLGTESDPSESARTIRKFGYDLFRVRGLAPTLWERLRPSLESEVVKGLITLIGGVALAALLVWLNLKRS